MFALQKYSLRNRLETTQYWRQNYSNRVAIVFDSSKWYFYKFRCLLVPESLTIQELTFIIKSRWFPDSSIQLQAYQHPDRTTQNLIPTDICGTVQQNYQYPDGVLYLRACCVV